MRRRFEMRKQADTPRLGVVYALFAGALGLLWLEERSSLTPVGHELAILGVVVAFSLLAFIWLGMEGRWP